MNREYRNRAAAVLASIAEDSTAGLDARMAAARSILEFSQPTEDQPKDLVPAIGFVPPPEVGADSSDLPGDSR